MKIYGIIVLLAGVGILTAGAQPSAELLSAAVRTPTLVADIIKASANEHEAAQAVAQLIWMIHNSNLSDAEKTKRIAHVVAETIRVKGDKSSAFMAPVAERMNLQLMPVVTAAAVISSGTQSPRMLATLVKVSGPSAPSIAVVRTAAANPVAVLGAKTAAELPVLSPTLQTTATVTVSSTQQGLSTPATPGASVASSSGGTPATTGGPRPAGMVPRPIGMPYRGQ